MADRTAIEWTSHTFNPWIGCTKVSPGCANCYAEKQTPSRVFGVNWGKGQPRHRTSESNWKKPLAWNRAAKLRSERDRVFCASMADVFDTEVEQSWRDDLWELIAQCPSLDWQLLTKRPQNVAQRVPSSWLDDWPENVWLGTSVENQRCADERIPILRSLPARVRFLSCEPLLGFVDLNLEDIHWILVGGESGSGCRGMKTSWARGIVEQCQQANVPVFVKQLGGHPDKRGEISQFPRYLRHREYPA
ncbi:MAG: phage Gp37/Gp68 family protein [Cyanobacteria bacterium J06648_11]